MGSTPDPIPTTPAEPAPTARHGALSVVLQDGRVIDVELGPKDRWVAYAADGWMLVAEYPEGPWKRAWRKPGIGLDGFELW